MNDGEQVEMSSLRNRRFYNVVILGLSLMCIFAAYFTAQNYITTLFSTMGFWSLASLYFFFALFYFIAPSVIRALGPRASLIAGSFTYGIFVLACCFKEYVLQGLLILVSVLVAFGGSITWAAQGTFLSLNACKENVGFYSGVFFGFFQFNGILGNAVAGSLFGLGFSDVWIFIILFCISFVGSALLFLLWPVEKVTGSQDIINGDSEVNHNYRSSIRRVLASFRSTFSILFDKRMILLSFVFILSGYSVSFFFGSIPPMIGKKYIGWSMVGFGVTECLTSIAMGYLSDLYGKRPCMLIAMFVHACVIFSTFLLPIFRPYMFFITTALCGVADACLNTQIYGILGSHFFKKCVPDAFAMFNMIQSLALSAGYLSGAHISFFTAQIVYAVTLVIAFIAFNILDAFIEEIDRCKTKRKGKLKPLNVNNNEKTDTVSEI